MHERASELHVSWRLKSVSGVCYTATCLKVFLFLRFLFCGCRACVDGLSCSWPPQQRSRLESSSNSAISHAVALNIIIEEQMNDMMYYF